jgi:hypothetical protein
LPERSIRLADLPEKRRLTVRCWFGVRPAPPALPFGWMESTEIPPLPKERREILEPLTPKELLLCHREANRDRREHIRKEHSDEDAGQNVDHIVENVLKYVLEEIADPRKAASGRKLRRSMGLPEEEVVDSRERLQRIRELLQWIVSFAASKYWTHVTMGHVAPRGSSDEYLRGLVERVQRESA